MPTAETEHLDLVSERLSRLTREAEAVVKSATLDAEGQAVVGAAQLTRLRREQPQPLYWMSVT